PVQGVVLTLVLAATWASRRWRRGLAARPAPAAGSVIPLPSPAGKWVGARPSWPWFAFNPLECAGASLVLGCYLIEWTFRGYLDLHNLRTVSPYAVVPWYDGIPQIGAVLFAIGWWSGPARPFGPAAGLSRLTRGVVLGLGILTLVLMALHRPRVD